MLSHPAHAGKLRLWNVEMVRLPFERGSEGKALAIFRTVVPGDLGGNRRGEVA
jgi:hypothetical protein